MMLIFQHNYPQLFRKRLPFFFESERLDCKILMKYPMGTRQMWLTKTGIQYVFWEFAIYDALDSGF